MKAQNLVTVLILSSALLSCNFFITEPFLIIGWTPGEGYFKEEESIRVSITFSDPPNIIRTEEAFSLIENGTRVKGTFLWEGAKMSFIPFNPFKGPADYRVSLGLGAMSAGGVSLKEALAGRFSTKSECVRPRVVATLPARAGTLAHDMDSVIIEFSEAIDREAYRGCITVSPPLSGVWSLEEGDSKARFTPLEPWAWASEYIVTIAADLLDTSGNSIGQEYSFRFSIGEDRTPPQLMEAWAIDESGLRVSTLLFDTYGEEEGVVNHGWERSWRLCLLFSEPVSTRTAVPRIIIEDGASCNLVTAEAYEDCLCLELSEPPPWGNCACLCVRPGIKDEWGNVSDDETRVRICFDGPRSRPPRFVGIRLALAPGAPLPEDRELATFSVDSPFQTIAISGEDTCYPIGVPTQVSIEVYVELAYGAALDTLSIMKTFNFSATNAALDFYAARVNIGGIAYAEPYAPWAGHAIARLDGTITNRVDSGVLTLRLDSGFMDSFRNSTSASQALVLLK